MSLDAIKNLRQAKIVSALPILAAIVGVLLIAVWMARATFVSAEMRVPGTDAAPEGIDTKGPNPIMAGKLIRGSGEPSSLSGTWPCFRGKNFNGISEDPTSLAQTWNASEPKQLWSVDLGEGYAGPAIRDGRVYVMDYDQQKKQDAFRCLSLADGKEIWRFAYPNSVKRNHGMSRTVPAVTDKYAVAMGPKCHVVCLDAISGELKWSLDLVREFGATVPQWYAGQNPLIDANKVILGIGGTNALVIAVSIDTGQIIWKTPNPAGWQMTHSSVMPMEFAGKKMFVYCGSHGVVGVSAEDGSLLWETTEWKISIATIPSPVILDEGRIFLSGGYNAGSLMLQLQPDGNHFIPKRIFKLGPEIFGATQHTPILYNQHLFSVRADGQFVCLDLNGKVVWTSGTIHQFGLGPFMLANGLIFAMNDSGRLSLFAASTEQFQLLAEAQVLNGRESWGPFALAANRLLARDFTRMVCLDVGTH